MAIKWKNNKEKSKRNGNKSILLVLLGAALAATVMCSLYPTFRERAKEQMESYESGTAAEETAAEELSISLDEDFQRYVLSSIYYMNYEITPDMDAYTYFTQNYDMNKLTVNEQERIREAAARLMKNMRNQYTNVQSMNDYESYASGVEKNFGGDGNLRDVIYGDGTYAREYYEAGIVIAYDSRGVPGIRDSWGAEYDEAELLGYLQRASMRRLMEDNGMDYEYTYTETVYEAEAAEYDEASLSYVENTDQVETARNNDELLASLPVPMIQNATFAFGIHGDASGPDDFWQEYYQERDAYLTSGYAIGVAGIILSMLALALILQNIPTLKLRENRLFCLPTELVLWAAFMGLLVTFDFGFTEFGIYTMQSSLAEDLGTMGFGTAAPTAATAFVWIVWFCFAFCCYWAMASVLPYITHPIRSLREHMLCIALCVWLKKQWLKLWHWATDIELSENLTRDIWKLVGLNGVIVAFFCCFWFGGVVGVMIYSIILYVLVKKKCGQIVDNYNKLLQVTRTIADGELNVVMDEDMGQFNPIRDELAEIRNGFKKAVHEEVRSRNMKTELITNVSHDLKTPLTAIITYVDLLKKEDITEEERREYICTLEKKSQRLKVLIEDLFEVSKASSDNITMNFTDVDLISLMKEVRLENEDKIAESTLDFRWNLPEEKCILNLDPQRTFRVIDNLVQNILKYSMPHSRVYIDVRDDGAEVSVTFKNMSAAEMNFSPEEITERFVRGDLSRNTEGSGLGLAIAQSFTELQKGTFKVETDGDLFKVTITWKK